jgi:hypothetical protein
MPEDTPSISAKDTAKEKIDAAKRAPSSFWEFLNSQFGLFILGAIFITGLGSLLTAGHQAKLERETRVTTARKLLAESRFRLNEVEFRAGQISNTKDVPTKQVLSRFIYAAAMGVKDFQTALPQYKGVHWAGVIILLDSLEQVDGFDEAMQTTRDFEAGFNDNGNNYFEDPYLEKRIKFMHEYLDRVKVKIETDDESSFWSHMGWGL